MTRMLRLKNVEAVDASKIKCLTPALMETLRDEIILLRNYRCLDCSLMISQRLKDEFVWFVVHKWPMFKAKPAEYIHRRS